MEARLEDDERRWDEMENLTKQVRDWGDQIQRVLEREGPVDPAEAARARVMMNCVRANLAKADELVRGRVRWKR